MTATFLERVEGIRFVYRIVIFCGTLVLLSGLFAWLVLWPRIEKIQAFNTEIRSLETQIQQAQIQTRNLPKLEAELARINAQFQQALLLLPDEKDIPGLLREVTQLGLDSNLQFRLFSLGQERPQDFYYVIPVSIEVSGQYHDVLTFFDKIGHMNRIVNVSNVSMKPVKSLSTTLLTTCTITTYRFKG